MVMKMKICKNKATDQVFVHLEAEGKDNASFVSPNGIVLDLCCELFSGPAEIGAEEALADGLINRAQYNVYKAYHGH